MTSEKLLEKLVSKYFDDPTTRSARSFRDDLIHLIRTAKAEQHVKDEEEFVSRPELRNAFFSIDSWR